jgi:hypothetical protein
MHHYWGFILAIPVLLIFGAAIVAVLLLDQREERRTRWRDRRE